LLRRPPNKRLGVQQVVQNLPDGLKPRVRSDPLDEVVLPALLLDHTRGLVGEDADALVGLLSVPGGRLCDERHDDVLGGHERQLLGDPRGDDLGVYDEALADILEGAQDDIGGEERFGEGHPAVCTGAKSKGGGEGISARRRKVVAGKRVNVGLYLSSNVLSNHCTLLVISAF
jgi:hypothetical protein